MQGLHLMTPWPRKRRRRGAREPGAGERGAGSPEPGARRVYTWPGPHFTRACAVLRKSRCLRIRQQQEPPWCSHCVPSSGQPERWESPSQPSSHGNRVTLSQPSPAALRVLSSLHSGVLKLELIRTHAGRSRGSGETQDWQFPPPAGALRSPAAVTGSVLIPSRPRSVWGRGQAEAAWGGWP